MKYILFPFVVIFCVLNFVAAQSPQGINYQAVVRNSENAVLSNKVVGLRFQIHDSLTSGPVVFQETHNVQTNQFGLATLIIGSINNLASVNWASGNKYLQVELDPDGDNNFTDMGTTQMVSVPFALYALSSGGSAGGDTDLNWIQNNRNDIYNADTLANTGIGTTMPAYTLDVHGNFSNSYKGSVIINGGSDSLLGLVSNLGDSIHSFIVSGTSMGGRFGNHNIVSNRYGFYSGANVECNLDGSDIHQQVVLETFNPNINRLYPLRFGVSGDAGQFNLEGTSYNDSDFITMEVTDYNGTNYTIGNITNRGTWSMPRLGSDTTFFLNQYRYGGSQLLYVDSGGVVRNIPQGKQGTVLISDGTNAAFNQVGGSVVASGVKKRQTSSCYAIASYVSTKEASYHIGGTATILSCAADSLQFQVVYQDETLAPRTQYVSGQFTASGACSFPGIDISVGLGSSIVVNSIIGAEGSISYNSSATIQFLFNH